MSGREQKVHTSKYIRKLSYVRKAGTTSPTSKLTQHNHQMGQRFRGEKKQSLEKWEKLLCSQRGKEGLSKYDTQKRK